MSDRSPSGSGESATDVRRRVLVLALDIRPDLTIADLHQNLAALDLDVPTDDLIADLDALGFDVEDQPAAVDGVAGGEAAPAPSTRTGGDDEPWTRRSVIIAAGIAVAVVLVAVALASRGGSDDGGADVAGPGPRQAGASSATGGGATTGSTAPLPVAPVGPGSDPALAVPEALTDDFERAAIEQVAGLGPYEVLAGDWAVTGGEVGPTAMPPEGALAAVDTGTADVRAQVQVKRRSSRSGLAFRIADGGTFLLWSTVPEYATNILFQVTDGVATPLVNSGITRTDDGLPALGINVVGTRVELLNDGVVVATYDQVPPAEGATRIGMAALPPVEGGGELPLFDDLKVLRPAG